MLGIVQTKLKNTSTSTTDAAQGAQIITEEAFEQLTTPEEDTYYFVIESLS